MTSQFKLSTKVMSVPLGAERRAHILAKQLSPADALLFDYPIEQWKTAVREDFEAFSNATPAPKTADAIPRFDIRHPLLRKIGVYPGPVTNLELDAIVNAANETCLGGGGVDGAIHRIAGPLLVRECATHNGCQCGEAIVTKGYNLAARYVIHTVGPMGERPDFLQRSYRSVLSLAKENGIRSIGLCGISTGIYGYPLRPATKIAVEEVTTFMREHPDALDFVCFACFLDEEVAVTTEELHLAKSSGVLDRPPAPAL